MAKVFEKELKEIARLIAGIERHSEENDPALDSQLKIISEIFDDFNRKYPKLTIKLSKDIAETRVNIFINESSVKKIFDDVASKLKGLTGIGLNSFDESTVQDAEKFASIVNGIQDAVFLTYSLDFGTETIVLEFNSSEKKIRLNYEVRSLANSLTPQGQLLAKYASMDSDKNIEILQKCAQLGFMDIEDDALFKWEDEFWPRMLD